MVRGNDLHSRRQWWYQTKLHRSGLTATEVCKEVTQTTGVWPFCIMCGVHWAAIDVHVQAYKPQSCPWADLDILSQGYTHHHQNSLVACSKLCIITRNIYRIDLSISLCLSARQQPLLWKWGLSAFSVVFCQHIEIKPTWGNERNSGTGLTIEGH